MPFSFPTIERETGIPFERRDVPFFEWAAERFNQATTQTAGRRLFDFGFETLMDDSRILLPNEATRLYGIPEANFTFDEPVRETTAKDRRQRKERELLAQSNAASVAHGNFSLKAIGTFPAAIAGQLTDPLELAINAIPFVGVGSKAAGAARLVGESVSPVVERGVLTSIETIAKAGIRYPVLAGRVLEATAGNIIAEVPVAVQNIRDKADYEFSDSVFNIAAGGLMSASIHGFARAMEGATHLMSKASESTHERAIKVAMAQATRGEDVNIAREYSIDPKVHLETMRFDETATLKAALSEPEIRDSLKFEVMSAASDIASRIKAGDIDGAFQAARGLPFIRDILGSGIDISNSINTIKAAIADLPDLGRIETDGRTLNQWIESIESGKSVEPSAFEKRSPQQLREISEMKRIPERIRQLAREAAATRQLNESFAPGSPAARSYQEKVKEYADAKRAEFDSKKQEEIRKSQAQEELAKSPRLATDEDLQRIKAKPMIDESDIAFVRDDAATIAKDLETEMKSLEQEAKAIEEADPERASMLREQSEHIAKLMEESDKVELFDAKAVMAAVECVMNSPE